MMEKQVCVSRDLSMFLINEHASLFLNHPSLLTFAPDKLYVVPLTESSSDYVDPGTATVTFASGDTLPAEECVNIETEDDSLFEGNHDFSAILYNTSLDGDSLVTILSDSSTTLITITDNDGETV